MTVVKFPATLPPPEQLELPRAKVLQIAHELTRELQQGELSLMTASSASEFAAAVRKIADKVAEANLGWTALSDTIRKSWGI